MTKNNTKVRTEDGKTIVTLHCTDIVQFDTDTVVLNSGGWRKRTTKDRMNEAAYEFGLGYRVHQSKKDWYVRVDSRPKDNRVIPFEDGMTIMR